MSLAIDVETIRSVMIGGKWLDIEPGSFDLDAFEFVQNGTPIHAGGDNGVCATGFRFEMVVPARLAAVRYGNAIERVEQSARGAVYGPLTAIEAVSTMHMGHG